MNLDKILLIPYLSKELNLIGYKNLPFKFKSKVTRRRKSVEKHESTDSESENENNSPVRIVFDSRKMINQLVTVSIDLVNQIKTLGFVNSNDEIDKLRFQNAKLEKQLNSVKRDVEKKLDELAAEKEQNRQLCVKIDELEKKLKCNETDSKKIAHKFATDENILKHNLKKLESNYKELHSLIWKQFNMVDKNYFPENFEIIHSQQPNFSKLWSDIRFSRPTTRENALKKAVCIFQENNSFLMEEVNMLKNFLLATLDEVNDFVKDISEKMHLKSSADLSLSYKMNELFEDGNDLDTDVFRKIIQQHFSFIKNVLEKFEEASFTVSDNLFVCWSDMIK